MNPTPGTTPKERLASLDVIDNFLTEIWPGVEGAESHRLQRLAARIKGRRARELRLVDLDE